MKVIKKIALGVGVLALTIFISIFSDSVGVQKNKSGFIALIFNLLGIFTTIVLVALANKYILKNKLPSLFKSPNNISIKKIALWILISFVIIFSTMLLFYVFGFGNFVWYNNNTTFIQGLVASLTIAIFAGFSEELCFRYLFYGYLKTITSKKVAIIICGLVFGALHLHLVHTKMGGITLMISAVLVTTMFIAIYELTNSIWPAAIAHSVWDMFTLQRGFIYTNTYNDKVNAYKEGAIDAYMGFHVNETNPIISGGAFGVEESLIANTVYILAILIFFYYYKKKRLSSS